MQGNEGEKNRRKPMSSADMNNVSVDEVAKQLMEKSEQLYSVIERPELYNKNEKEAKNLTALAQFSDALTRVVCHDVLSHKNPSGRASFWVDVMKQCGKAHNYFIEGAIIAAFNVNALYRLLSKKEDFKPVKQEIEQTSKKYKNDTSFQPALRESMQSDEAITVPYIAPYLSLKVGAIETFRGKCAALTNAVDGFIEFFSDQGDNKTELREEIGAHLKDFEQFIKRMEHPERDPNLDKIAEPVFDHLKGLYQRIKHIDETYSSEAQRIEVLDENQGVLAQLQEIKDELSGIDYTTQDVPYLQTHLEPLAEIRDKCAARRHDKPVIETPIAEAIGSVDVKAKRYSDAGLNLLSFDVLPWRGDKPVKKENIIRKLHGAADAMSRPEEKLEFMVIANRVLKDNLGDLAIDRYGFSDLNLMDAARQAGFVEQSDAAFVGAAQHEGPSAASISTQVVNRLSSEDGAPRLKSINDLIYKQGLHLNIRQYEPNMRARMSKRFTRLGPRSRASRAAKRPQSEVLHNATHNLIAEPAKSENNSMANESSYTDDESIAERSESDEVSHEEALRAGGEAENSSMASRMSVEGMAKELYDMNEAAMRAIPHCSSYKDYQGVMQVCVDNADNLKKLVAEDISSALTDRGVMARTQYWVRVADSAIRHGDFNTPMSILAPLEAYLDHIRHPNGHRVLQSSAIVDMPEYKNLQMLCDRSGNMIVMRSAMIGDRAYFARATDGSSVDAAQKKEFSDDDNRELREKAAQRVEQMKQLVDILPVDLDLVLPNVGIVMKDIFTLSDVNKPVDDVRDKLNSVLSLIESLPNPSNEQYLDQVGSAISILDELVFATDSDVMELETLNPNGFVPRLISDLRGHLQGVPLTAEGDGKDQVSLADIKEYNRVVSDSPYQVKTDENGMESVLNPPTVKEFLTHRINRVSFDQLAKLAYFFDNQKLMRERFLQPNLNAENKSGEVAVVQNDSSMIASDLERFRDVDETQYYDAVKRTSVRISDNVGVVDFDLAQIEANEVVSRVNDCLNPNNDSLHQSVVDACANQKSKVRDHKIAKLLNIRQESKKLRRRLTTADKESRDDISIQAQQAVARLERVEKKLKSLNSGADENGNELVSSIKSAIEREKRKFKRISADASQDSTLIAAKRAAKGGLAHGQHAAGKVKTKAIDPVAKGAHGAVKKIKDKFDKSIKQSDQKSKFGTELVEESKVAKVTNEADLMSKIASCAGMKGPDQSAFLDSIRTYSSKLGSSTEAVSDSAKKEALHRVAELLGIGDVSERLEQSLKDGAHKQLNKADMRRAQEIVEIVDKYSEKIKDSLMGLGSGQLMAELDKQGVKLSDVNTAIFNEQSRLKRSIARAQSPQASGATKKSENVIRWMKQKVKHKIVKKPNQPVTHFWRQKKSEKENDQTNENTKGSGLNK